MNGHTLSPALETLLAPQEKYQRIVDAAYRRAGRNLCDLGYANFRGGPPTPVVNVLRGCLDNMRELDLQYTPYGGSTITRRMIASGLSVTHGQRFRWREVIMTPGAMAALNLVFRALVARNEEPAEVIVPVPCWLDYPLYLVNLGLTPVLVPMSPTTLRLDLNRIEGAISRRTRAIIISQPTNPTGLVHTRHELTELAALLKRHGEKRILLISDECHRDVIFHGGQIFSPAKCYSDTVVIYSFGKAFRIQGQRIGYVAVSPAMDDGNEFARLLERLCRVTGFCTPTALMQLAVRSLLSLKLDIGQIAQFRRAVLRGLYDAGYDVHPTQATCFVYPKAPIADDLRFAANMAEKGLLVLPSALFHHRGHFRISLTAPESQIDRALQILKDIGTKQKEGFRAISA